MRLTRIAGIDAGAPVAPAITQVTGVTYDILLCQVLVDTAGTVAVTDERTRGQVPTEGIEDDAVTDEKLRDSVALSVIGRSANSAGDPADIQAAANDTFLARIGDVLQWAQLTIGMIPDLLITDHGFALTELDSVPGGIGLTAWLDGVRVTPRFPNPLERSLAASA